MSASFSTGLIGGNFVIGDNRIISISPSSGTNTAGQHLTLQSGQGTGTGTGGNIIFQTAPGGSSGSSANDLATKLTVTVEGIQVAGTGSMTDTLSLTKSDGTGLIVTKNATIGGNLTVTGNLTVSGTSTTITSSTLEVNDKNIVIGNVSGPTNSTADGGGITLKANGDKTIIYTNSGDRWTSNIHWNIASGKEYQINGTAILTSTALNLNDTSNVLTSTALGSTVVSSSLTSVGTLSSLNVSGDVGIGTTSPDSTSRLTISPSGSDRGIIIKSSASTVTGVNNTIDWKNNGGITVARMGPESSSHGRFIFKNAWDHNTGSADNGGFRFQVNDSPVIEALQINSNGNVGIGTTSPTHPFHTEGANYTSATNLSTSVTYAKLRFQTGGGSSLSKYQGTTGSGASTKWYNQIANYSGTTSYDMLINPFGGNVGIGGTSASYDLDVDGNINFTGNLTKNGSVYGGSSPWTTSGSDIYRSSGNVGIGTASPGYKLEVNGTAKLGSTTVSYLVNHLSSGCGIWFDYANTFRFITNSTEKMIIKPDGKVGIGADSPQSLLHISKDGGDALLRIQTKTGNTNLAGIEFWTDDSTSSSGLSYPATRILSSFTETTYETAYLKFQTHHSNSTTYNDTMIIKGPNVGIGTTSPDSMLELSKSLSAEDDYSLMINFENTHSTYYDWSIGPYNNSSNAKFSIRGGASTFSGLTNLFTVVGDGKVGIGTDSPSDAKLEIRNNHSQLKLTDSDDNKYAHFSYSSNMLAIRINSLNSQDFIIKEGGNVGIGTNSPYGKLHIKDGNFRVEQTGTNNNTLIINPNNHNNGVDIEVYQSDSASTKKKLCLNPYGGNVGIGNQSPSYKLDVSGEGRFTGDLTVGGNLTINGTTTTVNSTTMTVDDPIITLGGDTAPGSDDNKDRGVEFRYYDGSAKVGFMGWDDSAGGFVVLKDATNSSEVFSGTAAELKVGSLTIGSDTVSNLSSLLTTASNLSSLNNVATTTPSNTQVLAWNGSAWAPADASGGAWSTSGDDINYTAGKVGIGTTSPNAPLEIHGGAGSGDEVLILSNSGDDSTTGLHAIFLDGGHHYDVYNSSTIQTGKSTSNGSNYHMNRYSAGDVTMCFGGGNVGIGTTSPDYPLHVNGSTSQVMGLFEGSGDAFLVIKGGNSSNNDEVGIAIRNIYDNGDWIICMDDDTVGNLYLQYNPSRGAIPYANHNQYTKMTFQQNGNVGIGTTEPQSLLHISKDGGDALLRIQTKTGNTNLAGIEFWTDDSTSSSGLSYPATRILSSFTETTYETAYLKFQTHHSNSTTYNDTMIIKGPNVGIGATSPNSPLEVHRNGSSGAIGQFFCDTAGNSGIVVSPAGGSDYDGYIELRGMNSSTTHGKHVFIGCTRNGSDTYNSNIVFKTRHSELSYQYHTAAERMRIQYNGNVGIGTTSPIGQFQVATTSGNLNAVFSAAPQSDCRLVLQRNHGGDSNSIGGSYNTIGDTYYVDWLIDNNSNNSTIGLKFTSKYKTYPGGVATTNDAMFLHYEGNVGIGTTSPSEKLEVSNGTTNEDVFIQVTNEAASNSYNCGIKLREGTTNKYGWTLLHDDRGDNGTANNFEIISHNNSTTGDCRFAIERDTGNVGIGTASPQERIHIYRSKSGNTFDRLMLLEKNTSSDFSEDGNGSGGYIEFITRNQGANYYGNARIGCIYDGTDNDESSSAIVFWTSDGTGTGSTQYDGGSAEKAERMRINHNGNVGIGTTNPLYPLHVKTGVAGYSGQGFNTQANTLASQAALNNLGRRYAVTISTGGTISSAVGNWHQSGYNHLFSALFQENIAVLGPYLVLASDERIKENITDVNDNYALTTLRNIPVRYYEYKDKTRGVNRTIGFIAQEVREILPEAVNLAQHFIPNVMSLLSNISWEKIDTNKYKLTSNLQDVSGVKYRFYVLDNIENENEREKEVELVGNSDNTFTFDHPWKTIFCYGKQVDDFHRLDKNKLFTINFSATQELDRQQQADKAKIASLETKVASLESELAAIKAHLGL